MEQPRRLRVISLPALLLVCYLRPIQALSRELVTVGEAEIARHPRIHFSSALLSQDAEPLSGSISLSVVD